MPAGRIGFTAEEINTAEPTRAARLKWVIVVDCELAAGRAVNAAACLAAATGAAVSGLLGPDAIDASGSTRPGLPWAGCTVLAADSDRLGELRARAAAADDVYVADMPAEAQLTRVYDEYLDAVSAKSSGDLRSLAVSVVGPRNRIDRLVKRLPLLA